MNKENDYPHYYINQDEDTMYIFDTLTSFRRLKCYDNAVKGRAVYATASNGATGVEAEIDRDFISVDLTRAQAFIATLQRHLAIIFELQPNRFA